MGGIEREPVTSNSRAFPPILAVLVARISTDLMDVRSHPLTPRNDEPAGVHGGMPPCSAGMLAPSQLSAATVL
jgi:hypothetical protein